MIIMLSILLALAIYDAIHTTRMLTLHGLGAELNPVIRMLAKRLGSVRAGGVGRNHAPFFSHWTNTASLDTSDFKEGSSPGSYAGCTTNPSVATLVLHY